MLYIFKKTLSLSFSYSKCCHEYEKVFKKEVSIEILKILGLISNMEYQKLHNQVQRKHKSII